MTAQTTPDRAGTWEPNCTEVVLSVLKTEFILDDWTARDLDIFGIEMTEAVVAEYRRQQAERGVVEVDREDVLFAARMLAQGERVSDEHSQAAINRLFAAAKEQQ
jgi:hypothetical protein